MRERGFTLLESLLVIGLSTLISVGLIAGLIEGLDSLHQMTDRQTIESGQQQAMQAFMSDVQAAEWFNNSTVQDETGSNVLNGVADPYGLVLGYTGPDGEDVWVRYHVRPAPTSNNSYLVRTMMSSGADQGVTSLASDVVNCQFTMTDQDGNFTDQLNSARQVAMLLTLQIGAQTVQRTYGAVMRNANVGVKGNPPDFNSIENDYFSKKYINQTQ